MYNQEHAMIAERVAAERLRLPVGGVPSVLSSLLHGGNDVPHGLNEFQAFAELFPLRHLKNENALQCMNERAVLPALGELLSAGGVPFETKIAWVRAFYFAWSAEGKARDALASLLAPEPQSPLVRGVLADCLRLHFQKFLGDASPSPARLLRLDPFMYGVPEAEAFLHKVYQFMCTVEERLSPPSCEDWEGPAALVPVLREVGTVSLEDSDLRVCPSPSRATEHQLSEERVITFAWRGDYVDETLGALRGWLSVAPLPRTMCVTWEPDGYGVDGSDAGIVRVRM